MTRSLVLSVAVVAMIGVVGAQAPSRPDPRTIRLRGDRFKPLT